MICKYTAADHRIYAFLNEVDPKFHGFFDAILTDENDPAHDVKLDRLAESVLEHSRSDNDWIVFIDGDAFPVKSVVAEIARLLEQHPLIAIQRLENDGEQHAHPSFCVTTVGFWRSYQPSWRRGFTWISRQGKPVTDVGGDLLRVLEEHAIPWKPLHRTNSVNLHPVCFGIYGDLVYHHGTGFRPGIIVRQDHVDLVEPIRRWDGRLLLRLLPMRCKMPVRKSFLHPQGRMLLRLARRNRRLHAKVYTQLITDADACISGLR
jgi:hypothetical protein